MYAEVLSKQDCFFRLKTCPCNLINTFRLSSTALRCSKGYMSCNTCPSFSIGDQQSFHLAEFGQGKVRTAYIYELLEVGSCELLPDLLHDFLLALILVARCGPRRGSTEQGHVCVCKYCLGWLCKDKPCSLSSSRGRPALHDF